MHPWPTDAMARRLVDRPPRPEPGRVVGAATHDGQPLQPCLSLLRGPEGRRNPWDRDTCDRRTGPKSRDPL